MSCIIHEYKFIFIHVAKCAGCSIRNTEWMRSKGLEKECTGHQTIKCYEKKFSHLFDEYFKFAFVRNPWDRIVSAYEDSPDTMKEIPRFEKFVDILYKHKSLFHEKKSIGWSNEIRIPDIPKTLIHFWPAHLCLKNNKGELKIDFIGKFENLQKDFDKISESIGVPSSELPHHNERKTKGRGRRSSFYKDLYNDTAINQVAEIYKDDIELFKYEY